jgi:hypothetical protein
VLHGLFGHFARFRDGLPAGAGDLRLKLLGKRAIPAARDDTSSVLLLVPHDKTSCLQNTSQNPDSNALRNNSDALCKLNNWLLLAKQHKTLE